MDATHKTAIVTGGASGFGKAIALQLAQSSWQIVVGDLDAERAAAVVDEISGAGGAATFCRCDVSSGADFGALVEHAMRCFGRLDLTVNNAGVSHRNQPMLEVSEAQFDRIYSVNCKSIYWSAIHCVPIFQRQGAGAFLNIASTAGVRPRPGLTWYNGSKGAVIVLTKSMAVELAPYRIRVNAINPVIGETALLSTFMGMEDTPENRAKFIATIPLGRMSRPSDIGAAAAFLCSDAAEFITGVCLDVDGGRCI